MSLICIQNLSVSYESVKAVDNISLNIDEGDYMCIIGRNGSGKSSLIKAVLGLVPYCGNIQYNINKSDIAYLAQKISIPHDLPATAREIVLTGTQKKRFGLPFYTKDDKIEACKAMRMLEVDKFSRKQISQLSGGQQQRVMLARALCRRPRLLILDEPFSGLDEEITKSLYNTLAMLNKTLNVTILMISHDLNEVKSSANKIAFLSKNLLFCGSADEFCKYNEEGAKT